MTTWAILGTGSIARKFASDLRLLKDARRLVVASREQAKAEAFAKEFGFERNYGSYEALLNDAEVEVVYIASPHSFHKEHSIMCLESGKHVLCEKPFAINAQEVSEMIAVARREKRFLMEALWSYFLPAITFSDELIKQGEIGNLQMIQADFGFRMSKVLPAHRLFDLKLGGGSLLDVGIYPVSLAMHYLGQPLEIKALAHLGQTGADEQSSIIMRFAKNALAMMYSAIRTDSHQEAVIYGTKGNIRLKSPWWATKELTLNNAKGEKHYKLDFEGFGYHFEASHVMQCLQKGLLESPKVGLDHSQRLAATLDAIRQQIGLSYPQDGVA
ncbi:MAG: Gfo/Idh/MocA family oxidoreductase [Deinococcales bacterium]